MTRGPCLIASSACRRLPARQRAALQSDAHIGDTLDACIGHGILCRCGTTSSLNAGIFPASSRWHRQGFVRRHPARRERRSGESRAHREVPHSRHGWDRPVSNRRSEARHVYRHVHVVRILNSQTRGHRADRRRRDDDQCRPPSGSGRGNDHRHRSDARRRHADEHETPGRAHQRGARRGPRDTNLRQRPGDGARGPVADARRELHPVDDRDRHEFLLHVAGRAWQ